MPDIQTATLGTAINGRDTLRVTLVNNMADAALAITEQRFLRLLQASCPDAHIDFRCVTLPAIPRGEMAEARIAKHYITLDGLYAAPPDALIFSGAEPVCRSLKDENFWPHIIELFDWSKAQNIPTLFSCLAAHAAVLHFAGIERHRLARKMFGIFPQSVVSDHSLLHDMPRHYSVPHSRWNDLLATDLVAGGYQVLSKGEESGVDMFVPAEGAQQVFLQGHPEYEPSALLGEYKRDLRRYESGLSFYQPQQPLKEGWGSSALGGSAYTPIESHQTPKSSANSLDLFQTVICNWARQKREMVI